MYTEHHMFHTPEDSTTIWRYIDFTKLVDLLETSSIFFCRSDMFEDPYEGYFKLKDHDKIADILEFQELTKRFYFLNCWHMNETQSDAMWKIYLSTKNGIAIKSSVKQLKLSFQDVEEEIFIGKVYYRDFDKVTYFDLMNEKQNEWPDSNGRGRSLSQFNYKRSCFEHEKELRIMYIDTPIPHVIKGGIPRDPLESKSIKVNLKELLDSIVVAPYADEWFKKLVPKIIKRYNINCTIEESNLYTL